MPRQNLDLASIFNDALEIESLHDRDQFLKRACDGNPDLLAKVTELIDAFMRAGDFLNMGNSPDTKVGIPHDMLGATVGSYRLEDYLGEGGMGIVYAATQSKPLKRTVAIKIIKPGMDTREVIHRFQAERQILAILDHPTITKVFDAGATESGHSYFVMELIRGKSITDYSRQAKLTVNERLQLIIQVCDGVLHAHQKGIIHRDLKPQNVLVEDRQGQPIPKIIDFGIAKALDQRLSEGTVLTRHSQILGTPIYMSPEQLCRSDEDIDVRTDVYSLGILIYELVVGVSPFGDRHISSDDFEEQKRVFVETPLISPSQRIRDLNKDKLDELAHQRQVSSSQFLQAVNRELDWILLKALAKDRTERYRSVDALAADLERFLKGEPVEASPPSRFYILRKAAWRYRTGISIFVSVMVLILVVCISAASITFSQMRVAQKLAQEKSTLAQSEQRLREESNKQLAVSLFEQSFAKCNPHDASSGLLWLSRSLENSNTLGATSLDQPLRRQIAGWKQLLPTLSKVLPHQHAVKSVKWVESGNFVITVSDDDHVSIWDINKESLRFPPIQDRNKVAEMTISPDERTLVTYPEERLVRFWQTETGQQVGNDLVHNSKVLSVAFSFDNSRLFTGCEDGTVCLWDIASGRLLRTQLNHESSVTCVVVSTDSTRVVTGCADGTGKIWDVSRDPAESVATFSHRARIVGMKLSPNGKYILTGSEDLTARIWDLETGKPSGPVIEHKDEVNVLAVSPDSLFIATGGKDRVVRLTSIESGKQIGDVCEHQAKVTSAHFSPDGRTLMTTGEDWKVRLWDRSTAKRFGSDINCGAGVFSAAFSRDGERILTGDGRGAAKIWDISGIVPTERSLLKSGSIHGIAISPQEDKILTVGYQQAQVWDAKTFQLLGSSPEFEPSVHCSKFSPNGKYALICIGDGSGSALLWNIDTDLSDFRRFDHKQQVMEGAFTPNSKQFVTACLDRLVRIWDVESGRSEGDPLTHPGAVTSVAVSPDGKVLVTGCEDGVVRLWDLQTRRLIESSMRHNESVWTVDFSRDGKTIVSGSFDHQVRFWDAKSGSPVRRSLDHGDVAVQSVQWSENEETLLVGNGRKEVVLWNLALNKQMSAPFPVYYGQRAFSIFPNENRWILGRPDGFVWVKKLPQPLQGTPQDISTWAKVVTGMELDESESIRTLDPETWRSLRKSLPNSLQPR